MMRKAIRRNEDGAAPGTTRAAHSDLHARVRSIALAMLLLLPLLASAQKLKQPPAQPFDINSATVEQLEQVPGIGPTIAESIVHTREKAGPYHRLEDLLAIRGISQRRLDSIRPYLTVTSPLAPVPTPTH